MLSLDRSDVLSNLLIVVMVVLSPPVVVCCYLFYCVVSFRSIYFLFLVSFASSKPNPIGYSVPIDRCDAICICFFHCLLLNFEHSIIDSSMDLLILENIIFAFLHSHPSTSGCFALSTRS